MSETKSREVDFEKLRFIRVFTPRHVPKELIEQVRYRDYDVEDWFAYQEVVCMRTTDAGPVLNPLNMLYVIADEGNKVVGTLWCEADPLGKALLVQTFSMNKAYWCKGKAVTLLAEKAKEIAKECKLKRIIWLTNYPKHSERYGFKRSRLVLMEYTGEEEDAGSIYGEHEACGERRPTDGGPIGLIEPGDTGVGAGDAASIQPVPAAV